MSLERMRASQAFVTKSQRWALGRAPIDASFDQSDGFPDVKEPHMACTTVPDTPLADTLFAITAASFEGSDLAEREIMFARIQALAASGAPSRSCAVNAGAASSTGLTVEDAQGILIAVAAIIGTALTGEAAIDKTKGLGWLSPWPKLSSRTKR